MFDTSPNRRVIEHEDGTVSYVLYNTAVVTLSVCRRTVVLRHGGYLTFTTRRAMNDALRTLGTYRRVYQLNEKWYITDGVGYSKDDTLFKDGISILVR